MYACRVDSIALLYLCNTREQRHKSERVTTRQARRNEMGTLIIVDTEY